MFRKVIDIERHVEIEATGFTGCKNCGKNLQVVRKSVIFRSDLGIFCCHACSDIYRATHDKKSLLGRMIHDQLDVA